MKVKDIESIVNKVYPSISKDYNTNSKVKLYSNIYERLDGFSVEEVDEYDGEFISYAEYLWDTNEIILYAESMDSEEDVIRSLIHESVHSNQVFDIWYAYYDQCDLDYDTHPYEIEAEHEELKWKKYKLNTNSNG